jgi:hypothetical protein
VFALPLPAEDLSAGRRLCKEQNAYFAGLNASFTSIYLNFKVASATTPHKTHKM